MNNESNLITIQNLSVTVGGKKVLDDVNFEIKKGDQWAITGRSGSGKTTLARALVGKIFYQGSISYQLAEHTGNILLIEQQHHFKNRSNTSDFYYQQRFNAADADNSITVAQALDAYNVSNDSSGLAQWIRLLHLDRLLQEPLIQLSNGENKRLQLAEALLSRPAILIMDNPFTGLDKAGRAVLNDIMDAIVSSGVHLILITSPGELPGCITQVGILENGRLTRLERGEYNPAKQLPATSTLAIDARLLNSIAGDPTAPFECAVIMKKVTVRYGDRLILHDINWQVRKGECWSVSGPNGAGKSTLLSLITADNPQAYANEIYLFDKRRGKGESIWDIKRNIGYVSPELHLFFERHNNCHDVIASGLFDTIGLFRPLNTEQEETVARWISLLQLDNIKQQWLSNLSLGQQRMVLLARALVKNPPLLILDEPCQGLDDEQADFFKNLVDLLCRQFGTTLLYVSHYDKDIPSCVDHFLKLDNGRQVEAL